MNPNLMAQSLMMSQGAGDEMMILVLVMFMCCCCILLLGAYYYMEDTDDDDDDDDNCNTYTNQITCAEDTTCSWDETTYTCVAVTTESASAAASAATTAAAAAAAKQPPIPANAAGSGGTPASSVATAAAASAAATAASTDTTATAASTDTTATAAAAAAAAAAETVPLALCEPNQKVVGGQCRDCPPDYPTTLDQPRADPNIIQDSPVTFCKKRLCLKDERVLNGNCWPCDNPTKASDAGANPNLDVNTTCNKCKVDHFINANGQCEACPTDKKNPLELDLLLNSHDESVCKRDPCTLTERMVCTSTGCECETCGNLFSDRIHTLSPDDSSVWVDANTNCIDDDSLVRQQQIIDWTNELTTIGENTEWNKNLESQIDEMKVAIQTQRDGNPDNSQEYESLLTLIQQELYRRPCPREYKLVKSTDPEHEGRYGIQNECHSCDENYIGSYSENEPGTEPFSGSHEHSHESRGGPEAVSTTCKRIPCTSTQEVCIGGTTGCDTSDATKLGCKNCEEGLIGAPNGNGNHIKSPSDYGINDPLPNCRNPLVATCGDSDGSGDNIPVTCGDGFIYDESLAASTCVGNPCDPENIDTDKTACCVAKGTCSMLKGDGDDLALANTACGEGYSYDTSSNDSLCAGETCNPSDVPEDKTACCVSRATCGNSNAEGEAVTDIQCGPDMIYDPSKSSTSCVGPTCDPENIDADKASCCIQPTEHGVFVTGSSCAGANGWYTARGLGGGEASIHGSRTKYQNGEGYRLTNSNHGGWRWQITHPTWTAGQALNEYVIAFDQNGIPGNSDSFEYPFPPPGLWRESPMASSCNDGGTNSVGSGAYVDSGISLTYHNLPSNQIPSGSCKCTTPSSQYADTCMTRESGSLRNRQDKCPGKTWEQCVGTGAYNISDYRWLGSNAYNLCYWG